MTPSPNKQRCPNRLRMGWLALLWIFALGACAPLHVTPPATTKNKQAILMLPGVGLKKESIGPIEEFGASADEAGFDFYLADYQHRKSIDAGVEALNKFILEQELERYQEVHVVAYILGGYTFNRYQQNYPLKNLGNVVYDRSPLQELAPRLATTGWTKIPAWLAIGPMLEDLASTEYSPLPEPHASTIGLMIENRATPFLRARKDRALEMAGPPSFDPSNFGQPFDEAIHVPLNHDEMYQRFDVIGPELLHFFKHGTFTPEAARSPLGIDPFAKELGAPH